MSIGGILFDPLLSLQGLEDRLLSVDTLLLEEASPIFCKLSCWLYTSVSHCNNHLNQRQSWFFFGTEISWFFWPLCSRFLVYIVRPGRAPFQALSSPSLTPLLGIRLNKAMRLVSLRNTVILSQFQTMSLFPFQRWVFPCSLYPRKTLICLI